MTGYQESKVKRDGVIIDVFERYPKEVKSVPALASKVDEFKGIYKEINKIHPLQEANNVGITAKKNATRLDIGHEGLVIAGALHAFAMDTANTALAVRTDLTITSFNQGSIAEFKKQCKSIVADARKYSDKVSDYGLDAATIDHFEQSSSGFEEVALEPRNATIQRSSATKALAELISGSDDIIAHHFDKLMVQFMTKNPNFYREYQSAKIIEEHGAHHRKSNGEAAPATPASK